MEVLFKRHDVLVVMQQVGRREDGGLVQVRTRTMEDALRLDAVDLGMYPSTLCRELFSQFVALTFSGRT